MLCIGCKESSIRAFDVGVPTYRTQMLFVAHYTSSLIGFGCLDAELLEGLLFTSVTMRNHGNRKVVNLSKQLTELPKAQVTPELRPQIKMS